MVAKLSDQVPRIPTRREETIKLLSEASRRFPRLRVMQLLSNALGPQNKDPYYVTDEDLLGFLTVYMDNHK